MNTGNGVSLTTGVGPCGFQNNVGGSIQIQVVLSPMTVTGVYNDQAGVNIKLSAPIQVDVTETLTPHTGNTANVRIAGGAALKACPDVSLSGTTIHWTCQVQSLTRVTGSSPPQDYFEIEVLAYFSTFGAGSTTFFQIDPEFTEGSVPDSISLVNGTPGSARC